MRTRIRLYDPVTLGFRLMLQTEQRLARRRIFWARAKFAATFALMVALTAGTTAGLMVLVARL